MIRFLSPVFVLVFLMFLTPVPAQENLTCIENLNIPDPLLINGRIYSYFPPESIGGNQFFLHEAFSVGTLVIRNQEYPGQQLNYDVYNQQLLLRYMTPTGALQIIEVSGGWLTSFSLEGREFRYRNSSESNPGIYQVIGDSGTQIFIHWEKSLEFRNIAGKAVYSFLGPTNRMFLVKGSLFMPFRNKRSFLRLLDPALQLTVRKYLNSEHVNFRHANDLELKAFILFYNTL